MGPTTTRWDRTLVIGEHTSVARDRTNACLQLMKIIVRQWVFDRSGGLRSEECDISTDDLDSRRRFIEFSLIYALMDLEQLGYDLQVFSDAACTNPFDPSLASIDQQISAFIKVQDITFQLIQAVFMREGLVCCGTVCFKTKEVAANGREMGYEVSTIVKMSWRLAGMVPEEKLLEEIRQVPGVGVVYLCVHDTGPNIDQGIYKGLSDGHMIKVLAEKVMP